MDLLEIYLISVLEISSGIKGKLVLHILDTYSSLVTAWLGAGSSSPRLIISHPKYSDWDASKLLDGNVWLNRGPPRGPAGGDMGATTPSPTDMIPGTAVSSFDTAAPKLLF